MEAILDLFEIHLKNPWIAGIINALIISSLFVSLAILTGRILRPTIHRFLAMFEGAPDEEVVAAFLSLIRKVFLVLGAGLAITALPLPPKIELFIHSTVFVIVSFFVLLGLFDLANIFSLLSGKKAPEFEILVNRVLKIFFATVTLMVTMRHFNYDIWHIMTALGVGTLAVGLAAQPTLSNMIAGFTILIDRPFRRGDRIMLVGGESGDVIHIGMRSTHILTLQGNVLVVSNSDMVGSRLVNYSFPNTAVGGNSKFVLEVESDVEAAKTILNQISHSIEGIVPGSANALNSAVNERGVEITVGYTVAHYAKAPHVADEIIGKALKEFRSRGIKVATSHWPKT